MKNILIKLVKCYRFIFMPILSGLGGNCRFYPSCSRYAEEALELHSTPRAIFLTFSRIIRCSPWTKGGLDPVPERKS